MTNTILVSSIHTHTQIDTLYQEPRSSHNVLTIHTMTWL